MQSEFVEDLQASVVTNDEGRVQTITHFDNPYLGNGSTAQSVAQNYIGQMSDQLGLTSQSLENMALSADDAITDSQPELRFEGEKQQFDNSTVTYQQTVIGLPVWGAGVTVQIKNEPYQVLNSSSTVYDTINVQKPSANAAKKYKAISLKELKAALGTAADANFKGELKVTSSSLYVYEYRAENRVTPPDPLEDESFTHHPDLALPAVPASIQEGAFYVVSAVNFISTEDGLPVPYIALIEVETDAVLYLRKMSSDVSGLVFQMDPITLTGIVADTPTSSNAVLNPLRSSVVLPGLVAPVLGIQRLKGNFVEIKDVEAPATAAPIRPAGANFDYNARTNEFTCVNAYYHNDYFFRFVTSLGFPASYWGTTSFPLPVDHRGLGNVLNAHCVGNGAGGIGHACYSLADPSNPASPLGIATDVRVVLHELGGHGILYCHVNSPNFGFAHSAGDSFAAILSDPTTKAPDRFGTFPWLLPSRRHDRSVAAGWAWGGVNDVNGYSSEQILSTTLFRIYRSIGGDSTNLGMRNFAARMASYLILRAVGNLTPTHATQTGVGLAKITAFVNELISANLGNWTSAGIYGGAYGKVIRWAFEKQGLFQAPGAPTPVTTVGKPPAVDVYINDGRNGEYTYQPVHWANTNIWNRRNPDGLTAHQAPIVGATNYAYVKIKNRGTSTATGVVVKGYHCNPGAGLTWPMDWVPMTTASIAAPNVAGNNASEIIVGPFKWVPTNVGHECMMMIVSAIGDASNVVNFGAGESIPEWRLVPNDNNIGQRNVAPVYAFKLSDLISSIQAKVFTIRNPLETDAKMSVDIILPKYLTENGVRLEIPEARERIIPIQKGESKRVGFKMTTQRDFALKAAEIKADPYIHVKVMADDIVIGGMSYYLDQSAEGQLDEDNADTRSGSGISNVITQKIKDMGLDVDKLNNVKVRKINVDLEFND